MTLGATPAIFVAAIALLLGAAACGSSKPDAVGSVPLQAPGTRYPAPVRTQFVNSCEAQANTVSTAAPVTITAYCKCSLRYLEAHLSYGDLKAADRAILALKAAPEPARTAVLAAEKTCKPGLGLE